MGRNSCCVKQKLRKGLWSPEEDEKLYNYITRFGVGCWSSVPKLAGLQRCGKSCRLRWINYLRPDLKRGMFSQEEEDLIIRLHQALGNRWAQIASQLPGRTDNEIKNFWNSSLKKKLIKHGIDPNTHKLINDTTTQSKHSTDSTSLHNLQPQSLTNSTPSSHMEQQSYNLSSSIICTNVGAKMQPSTDHFSIKEVYDPLFLSEFQSNIYPHYFQPNFLSHRHQNHLRPYETDGDLISPITRFNSIPSLTNFDHHIYTHYSSSRMSKIQNQMINNNVIENGGSFSWDNERKLDSVFQFELGGIQIEERKPNNLIPGDFSNYPLTSLCQELTGQNMDVFLGSI